MLSPSVTTGFLLWTLLGLLFAAVPLIVWTRIARTRGAGIAVGAALFAAGALLVAVQHGGVTAIPRADGHLLFAVLTPLLVIVGVRLERAQAGPAPETWERRRSTSVGVLGTQFALTLAGSLLAFLLAGEASVPSAEDVPELPPGLTVVSEGSGCGSSSCARSVTVGSRDGLTAAEIVRRLDRPHETCRANGWLLDRRPLCVGVREANGKVQLYVSLGNLID
ncbi:MULTISPECIES: MFS transporter [unclassified Streptomyces]|uniref:MFS transporter n=1 Tax=unclassified Streptomyces TaxID=2593676 RepID=UPI0037964E27